MRLVFAVTNDLNYDQRMTRICTSLAMNGYEVMLVGRRSRYSPPLLTMPFKQKRLACFFNRGPLGYAEFNARLFFFLLFYRHQLVCAIDLDTIMPCFFSSALKGTKRVYDAHELFCEMKEISSRPSIYRFWKAIEKRFVPRFKYGYTVNQPIADEFYKMYGVAYDVIRNMPVLDPQSPAAARKNEKYILYQGAVNEGRSFETLIPAMKGVAVPLIVCGDGNFMAQTKQLVKDNGLEQQVMFKGRMLPGELKQYTANAWLGVTLFDKAGLSNYYSLANRFFDYMHAGVPQICVNYPVYRSIVNEFPFARLIDDISAENIAIEFNNLLGNEHEYIRLQQECMKAKEVLNWQHEEKRLLAFYKKIITGG